MSNKPENLKPFLKGKDPRRNLKGKPVGTLSMTTKIKEFLMELGKDGETNADKLKRAIVLRAITKSDTMAKEILDRIDGKVIQPTDLTSGGKPLMIELSETIAKKNNVVASNSEPSSE